MAADFMQLSYGEYQSVYGEDKVKPRTQIVGPAVVLIKVQSSGRTLRGWPVGAVAHHCIGSSLYP